MGAALTNIDSIDGVAVPAGFGGGLVLPGALARPPLIASGPFAYVNNTDLPAASAVDTPYGWALTVPNPSGAGLAFVEPGSLSPTMSVEAAMQLVNDDWASGTQQMLGGVVMRESATNKWLSWQFFDFCDASGNSRRGVFLNSTGGAGPVQSNINFSMSALPFMRLRIAGADIFCEVSVDRINWRSIGFGSPSVPIASVFTVTPNEVGVMVSPTPSGGTTVASVCDYDAT
jgi:hypothetical protein